MWYHIDFESFYSLGPGKGEVGATGSPKEPGRNEGESFCNFSSPFIFLPT